MQVLTNTIDLIFPVLRLIKRKDVFQYKQKLWPSSSNIKKKKTNKSQQPGIINTILIY